MTDGPGAQQPELARPASKRSLLWLAPLALVALVASLGLWSVTKDEPEKAPTKPSGAPAEPAEPSGDPTLARIAIQKADLPESSIKCSFSGSMETYLQRLKEAGSRAHDTLVQTWSQLQAKGATAGYVSYWSDVQAGCDSVISPSSSMDQRDDGTNPWVAFSFVIGYKSPESAISAYNADIFGQSRLEGKPNFEATTGEETGLGPSSAVGLTPKAPMPLHQAIWQNRSVTVFFSSSNLPLDRSKQIPDSINSRIT
ncbi:MAG: hypothetical protein WKF86_05630 [Acidimicrobiales bacterium]